jgi:hypothetical protein
MHYIINPEDIKVEIEKLGHSVTNIWNIKQNRTKLPLSMFVLELQPAPNNKDIFNVEYIQQCKTKFEPPKETLPNMQTAKDRGTPKSTATLNQDVSIAQVTTQQINATKKKNRVMSHVSSVVEIILPITRDVWSTRTYKRKHTHLSIRRCIPFHFILIPGNSNIGHRP